MENKPYNRYGAEDLKQRYPVSATFSFAIASALIISTFAYPKLKEMLSKKVESEQLQVKTSRVINYSQLSAPPPIDLERTPPPTYQAKPKIKTVKFLKPVAKKDEEVEDDTEIPTMDDMANTQIGTVDQDGIDSVVVDVDFVVELPPEPEPEPQPEEVFIRVEQMPEFKGGEEAFMKYLSTSIKYPAIALDAAIEGIVYIEFVIEKDGTITHLNILRSVHPSLDQEAMRVIQDMPAWIPGSQNGKSVRVKFALPIRFRLNYD